MKWQQLAHTVDTFYCKSMSKSSKIHFCVLFKVRRLHLEFYVKKKNAANVLLEFCLILVSNPLPLLPSIIVCNRCYWSCLGILWDLRWGLFLPNTIMLINSCFGDLRPLILSGQPGPSCQLSGGKMHRTDHLSFRGKL